MTGLSRTVAENVPGLPNFCRLCGFFWQYVKVQGDALTLVKGSGRRLSLLTALSATSRRASLVRLARKGLLMSVADSPLPFEATRLFREQAAADLAEARHYFRLTLVVAAFTLGTLLAQLFG